MKKIALLVASLALVAVACSTAQVPDEDAAASAVATTTVPTATTTQPMTTTSVPVTTSVPATTSTTTTMPPYPWGWSEEEYDDRTPVTPTFMYLDGGGVPIGMSPAEYERRTSAGEIFRSLVRAPAWYLEAWRFKDAFAEYYLETTNGTESVRSEMKGLEFMDLSRAMVEDYMTARATDTACDTVTSFWNKGEAEDPELMAHLGFSLAWYRDVLQELEQRDADCGIVWPDIDAYTSG